MSYVWIAGAYRCVQIKDRNGNYLTVDYDDYGYLLSATDTLGRVVMIDYDSYGQPSTIKQYWRSNNGDATGSPYLHTYATLTYTTKTIAASFHSSLSVWGPPNSTDLRVLDKIAYSDQSFTKFYHNGYAQVYMIENHAPISGGNTTEALNRVTLYDLTSPSGTPQDCPKFADVRNYAKDFNGNADTITTINRYPSHSYTPEGGSQITATRIEVSMANHPHNAVSKMWVAESGWKEGLTLATEDWAWVEGSTTSSELKRWTWTNYTQDDNNVSYLMNPRVVETRVGDATNVRKTAIDYELHSGTDDAKYGRVSEVRAYASPNLSTVLKKAKTAYSDNSAYITRRLVRLPVEQELFDGGGVLWSKVTYGYDYDDDFNTSGLNQDISPDADTHDTSFGATFSLGRGNVTSVTRCDAGSSSDTTCVGGITSTIKYNTAGSLVARIDPLGRTVKLAYEESVMFNDGITNRDTFAYPTKVYDPAGNYSEVKYRFDIGANVEAKSPAPGTLAHGKRSTRTYDTDGRLSKETVWKWNGSSWAEHGYTEYDPQSNGVQLNTFSTLVNVDNDSNIEEDELETQVVFDGAGRRLRSRTENPDSEGGWSAVKAEYDKLGRVTGQSVPTEVDSAWAPDGDDTAFRMTYQTYDWMGRVKRIIPPDSNGSDGRDQKFTYSGCGCSGGLITTIEGEETVAKDMTGVLRTDNRQRVQKVYQDSLGRTEKVEIWDLNAAALYSSTVSTFNGRDQVLTAVQTDHSGQNPVTQTTTMTYDGHGRLDSQHLPQQDANTSTDFTYFDDDQLHVRTDARGATTTMTYADPRGLVTKIESELAGATNPTRTNFAYFENGGVPTASSEHSSGHFPVTSVNNGDKTGNEWGNYAGGWNDNTYNSYPDWVEVAFDKSRTIDEIKVITMQADYETAGDPDETTTFAPTDGGITDYLVQYWDGSAWTTVSGGNVTSNTYALRKFQFTPVTTNKIRVYVTGSYEYYSRIVEIEAWGPDSQPAVNAVTEFDYDNAGNRTLMEDSSGQTAYEYDSLSRMTAETRSFEDALAYAPLSGNSFKLQYNYTVAGGLRSITDPYGDVINYEHDVAGRLTSVTGSSYGGLTNYAASASYTAWGGLKGLTYGNGVQMATTFNDRLMPETFDLSNDSTEIMRKNYEYHKDGKLKYTEDELNPIFDRLNVYDHVGRINQGKTGLEARGTEVTTNQNTELPYRQGYAFNGFNNMTGRNNLHWGVSSWGGQSNNLAYAYANNRITNSGWQYDADGRVLQTAAPDSYAASAYDAGGRLIRHQSNDTYTNSYSRIGRFYDGDGREVKREKFGFTEDPEDTIWPYGTYAEEDAMYYIRSTVLGGAVVSETYQDGRKKKTFVLAAGAKIATQTEYPYSSSTEESVIFEHFDASGMSYRSTSSAGAAFANEGQYDGAPAEMDPMGGNVGLQTPYVEILPLQPVPTEIMPYFPLDGDAPMYVNGQRLGCSVDGMSIGCGTAMGMLENGSAIPAALAGYQNLPGFQFQSHGLGIFTATITQFSHYSVSNWDRDNVYSGTSWEDAANAARKSETFSVTQNWNVSTVSFSISWGVSIPSSTRNGSEVSAQSRRQPSNVKSNPKVDMDRLKQSMTNCIKDVFKASGIKVTDIKAATPTQNGSITYTNRGGTFTIESGVNFSSAQMDGNYGFTVTQSDARRLGPIVQHHGQIISTDPTRFNYVANDGPSDAAYPLKALIGNMLDAQVHENGHSLAARLISGKRNEWEYWAQEYENCVYREYTKR